MAMNMGADDFLNKPFAMEVLIAKINALLRRTYNYADQGTDVLEHNGLMYEDEKTAWPKLAKRKSICRRTNINYFKF